MDAAQLDANPLAFLSLVFKGVVSGDFVLLAASLLVALVAALRKFGKALHDYLPDDSPFDVPLHFLFETKPGGWLLNTLTTVAGGLGTALLAGQPVTWALLKPILAVSLSGAALWGAAKDIAEWRSAAKPAPVATTAEAVAELNK